VGLHGSNRDPPAEIRENPGIPRRPSGGICVNEHTIRRNAGAKYYALALLEAFAVIGILVLPTAGQANLHAELGKRHSREKGQLQFI
jgi:hypothetical protein